MVTLRVYGYFRRCLDEREMSISGKSVYGILKKLLDRYDCLPELLLEEPDREKKGEMDIKPYIKIMVNGMGIESLDGLETELEEDDTMVIFPPVGGG